MKGPGFKTLFTKTAGILVALLLLCATAAPEGFMQQRRKFRSEIKEKIEKKIDDEGRYLSVIFEDEKGEYDFEVCPEDRQRLKSYMKDYFGCHDESLLDKMVDEADKGHYIIYKDYKKDGVTLKVVFLSPKAKYWKWLTDIDHIEKMFHVYNYSVGIDPGKPKSSYVVVQTEGSFFGITQKVNVPVYFEWDYDKRTMEFYMPEQEDMIEAVRNMPPVKPGRTSPKEKFIDACRTHPYFQRMDGDEYVVSDDDIEDLYRETVTHMEEECPVKASDGFWRIEEDYPYMVVTYSLKTRVNVDALIPRSMRFLAGQVEDLAQVITDAVSVEYLPLSMKNFRDHTQEWTKTGGPE